MSMGSAAWSRPRFTEGIAVALIASVCGAIVLFTLGGILAGDLILRMAVAGLGLAYVLYLLARSEQRVGRVVVVSAWLLGALLLLVLNPGLPLYVAVHVIMVWLVRSLYFYSSILSALLDLGLTGFSFAAAVWAGDHTGSLIVGVWSFFLLQALFASIPVEWRKTQRVAPTSLHNQAFEQAYRAARSAARELTISH